MADTKTTASIHLRLLVATLVILPLFLGVTAWVLDRAFANYQLQAQGESMRLQQLLLAKAADWDGSRWVFDALDEPRLTLLNSGLYAFVVSPQGTVLWESPSAGPADDSQDFAVRVSEVGEGLGFYRAGIGENRLAECALGNDYYCHSTRVAWGSSGPESIFLIVESQAGIIAARNAYRSYLLWLLLGTTLLLLLAQSLIFRWGLAPLRKIATGIKQLEQGEKDQLGGPYPKELVPLTDNINVLLASEKNRRERVRNTMDRLTHVLKTPLMLIRNSSDGDREFRNMVQEQVTRMLGIVEGELAKARLDGRVADILGKPVPVQPVLQRIVDAYSRLPPGGIDIDTRGISSDAVFHGDERDLQDLFGSILENSLKYCRRRITVSAQMQVESAKDWLVLTIGDDGDGIAAGYEQEILQRGSRADTANAGQGLGLSIVVAIISAYGGSLHTDHSDLGGALFIIKLPGLLGASS
jgi:two-component system sensor histidine kinase PhoQ